MKTPGGHVYEEERKAIRQSPPEFERSAAEDRFEDKLLADPWYVWPVLGALTTGWIASVAFRGTGGGVAALLEVAAFSGLAARQVATSGIKARYGILFLVWGEIASLSLPAGQMLGFIGWLAGAFALGALTLVAAPRTRLPLGWLLFIVCALPWMQSPGPTWGVKLGQTILLFIVVVVLIALREREARWQPAWNWQRIALAGWVILIFHPPTATGAFATLALAVVSLVGVFAFEHWLQRPRSFLVVVVLWTACHLLGLRSGGGSSAIRLALLGSGFLLLAAAGWRFAELSAIRWWDSIFINSPRCMVPRLDRSTDYPLKIDVA